jgi:hypothetical protein
VLNPRGGAEQPGAARSGIIIQSPESHDAPP